MAKEQWRTPGQRKWSGAAWHAVLLTMLDHAATIQESHYAHLPSSCLAWRTSHASHTQPRLRSPWPACLYPSLLASSGTVSSAPLSRWLRQRGATAAYRLPVTWAMRAMGLRLGIRCTLGDYANLPYLSNTLSHLPHRPI